MASTKIVSGTILADRFQIQGDAGSGGMGVIYRATDRRSGAPVAVKLLAGDDLPSQTLERFAREAKILAELRHPGIVGYVANGRLPDGRGYLVMEWIEGEELGERIARGPVTLQDCMTLLCRVADALAAAHRRGVVHRDIKPSNILLRDGQFDRATLVDFGIARTAFGELSVTGTGVLVGTPEYMAPEQARAEKDIGPRADIFSLGCVLYQCLTGRHPFRAERVAAMLAKILFEEAPPVYDFRPRVPPELAALVHRMLTKDPQRRPEDAIALCREIEALPELPVDADTQDALISLSPPSAMTGREQVIISVVMASPPETPVPGAPIEGPLLEIPEPTPWVNELVSFGARVERLADGSLAATLTRLGSSAVDLVEVAARCALIVRERWPEARIALATGRGVVSHHLPAMGEAIERAVRLLHASAERATGPAGQRSRIWLDDASAGLLGDRFAQIEAGDARILEGERASVVESRFLLGKPTPCVGRELELASLEGLLSSSIDASAVCAVLVTAPAGMGKSRLRYEILRRQRARFPDVTVLIGRGNPMSAGSPYGLLGQALCQRFGVQRGTPLAEQQARILEALEPLLEPSDVLRVGERLGELCGVPFPDDDNPPLRAARMDPKVMGDEIRQAFLDWLRRDCAAAPVLLVLEDLHWGDALTLKLIDAAMKELSDLPFIVLAFARPEVWDLFPKPWPWLSQEISLRPLSPRAGQRLIRDVLGPGVSPATQARIVEQAEGNALYLEELIRAAAYGRKDEAPETLLLILQARLLRLDPGARRVLRAASIFGETFWSQGVRELHGGSPEEIAAWLRLLIEAEIIEARRESRLPAGVEHRFRHALLREAAYRLVTDEDRAAGHRAASAYLEQAGETDPMVIAEHARRGGDLERALAFFLRAAEQSWERNDFDGTLARVERCVACGARGQALGTARALECQALVGKVSYPRADAAGTEAITLLMPGSLWWCRAVEKLLIVLPHAGQTERVNELSELFLRTHPADEAGTAYVVGASYNAIMLALTGARVAAKSFLDRLRTEALWPVIERDPIARGWACSAHGWYCRVLEPDPYFAMTMALESDFAFEEVRTPQLLALSKLLVGITTLDLGDLAGGEIALRNSLAIATQTNDAYVLVNTRVYLAFALAERDEPDLLDEAHKVAESLVESNVSAVYQALGRTVLAQVMLQGGRPDQAAKLAATTREPLSLMPPFAPLAMAVFITALVRQDRLDEACASADEGLRLLASLGGTGWSEVPLRVAAVEAFYAAKHLKAAAGALRETLHCIERRADNIRDATWRRRYLTGRPENVRAVSLAQDRLGQEGVEWRVRLVGAPPGALIPDA